jgi:hypothetical protein
MWAAVKRGGSGYGCGSLLILRLEQFNWLDPNNDKGVGAASASAVKEVTYPGDVISPRRPFHCLDAAIQG